MPSLLSVADEAYFKSELDHTYVLPRSELLREVLVCNRILLTRRSLRFHFNLTHPWKRQFVLAVLDSFILVSRVGAPLSRIETAFCISDQWSRNYFHWLTDSLPKVLSSTPITKEHPVLITEFLAKKAFVIESLELLGVPFKYEKTKGNILVNRLTVLPPLHPTGSPTREAILSVRERLVSAAARRSTKTSSGENGRRFWISRKKDKKRFLINEEELTEALRQFGIRTVSAESLSLAEQINLFRGAEFIGGIHGAGLTNGMWMSPGAILFELRVKELQNNCYFALADSLNLEYRYAFAEIRKKSISGRIATVANVAAIVAQIRDMFGGHDDIELEESQGRP